MTQLTKTSTSNEIKQYFNAILKLAQSNERFPVDFDTVWPLVYGSKKDATDVLKRDFLQLADNESLGRNPERFDYDYLVVKERVPAGHTVSIKENYYLSVACLEFFIARKKKEVFEVYRKVFHQTVDNTKLLLNSPEMTKTRIMVAEWAMRILNVNEASKLAMVKAIAEPIGVLTPDYAPAEDTIHSATDRLTKRGIGLSAIKFNKMMVEAGLIKRASRYSRSKGKDVTWPVLTDEGKIYGENLVSPDNPRQTQPSYFDGKFDELLEKLGINNKN
ncbi:MAG: hypothetical protein ACK5LF_03885 [Bacteroides xylanisolvens]